MDKEIRLLRAEEIECRVGTINENGLSLLLYKDARADMRVLDETFGCLGWKRSHQLIDGSLYCTVEVWDEEKKQWIGKQDVGTVGYTEQEKSRASDSFKRSCVSVGIGRELYSAPFIWLSSQKCKVERKGDKFFTKDKFKVRDIFYNENREITGLVIVNQAGAVVYEMRAFKSSRESGEGPIKLEQIQALELELARTGVTLEAVLSRYHIMQIAEMTPEIYQSAMNSLRKTKPKVAA